MNEREILGIVSILMMVGVAFFIIVTLEVNYEPMGVSTGFDGEFIVTNNSVDQSLSTTDGLADIVVTKWNGYEWTNVHVANVSYSGTIVRVQKGGLD